MNPRADYECRRCEKTIPDLPVESIRCPMCGQKRGFRRLFNKVNTSTKGRRIAKFIDRRMRPAFDQHTSRQQSAKRFETAIAEVKDRIIEQATPEQRQQIAVHEGKDGMRAHRNIPAAAAMSMIDPIARHDSAVYTYPALRRRVIPEWQK